MDGKPNTVNENSRAIRRTSLPNRLGTGEDKSKRNEIQKNKANSRAQTLKE